MGTKRTLVILGHPDRAVIRYSLPRPGNISLKLYDVTGKLVTTLANGAQRAGSHRVAWSRTDGRGGYVSTGIYIYRLTSGDGAISQKLIVE